MLSKRSKDRQSDSHFKVLDAELWFIINFLYTLLLVLLIEVKYQSTFFSRWMLWHISVLLWGFILWNLCLHAVRSLNISLQLPFTPLLTQSSLKQFFLSLWSYVQLKWPVNPKYPNHPSIFHFTYLFIYPSAYPSIHSHINLHPSISLPLFHLHLHFFPWMSWGVNCRTEGLMVVHWFMISL